MRRIISVLGIIVLFINTSCKKCKQCYYTYSTSEIVQTPNGEETIVTEGKIGYVVNDDGGLFQEECVKNGEPFTIEALYLLEQENTALADFEYFCEDR